MQISVSRRLLDQVRHYAALCDVSEGEAITLLLTESLGEELVGEEPETLPRPDIISDKREIYQTAPCFRVAHSDCIAFLRTLHPDSVDLIVTDPAYSGMNQYLKLGRGKIIGNYQSENNEKWFEEFHDEPETYRVFLAECFRVLKPHRHIYLMFDSFSLLTLAHDGREVFDVKNVLVWDKVNLGMGHYFRRRHEHILFASKGKRRISRRDIPDIWAFKRVHRAPYPTQKPVELFERMIESSAEPGFTVCDPFAGSGSSAVAALKRGCDFVGCDTAARAVEMTTRRCEYFLRTGEDTYQAASPAAPEEELFCACAPDPLQ